jgi:hypothetical protein
MPEATAILAVFVVTIVSWLGAWMPARVVANQRAVDDTQRFQLYVRRLEQRLDLVGRENLGQ